MYKLVFLLLAVYLLYLFNSCNIEHMESSTNTFNVSSDGFIYIINGKPNPILHLKRGQTYKFILDGTTTYGHPMYISTLDYGGGSISGEYLTGVTGSRKQSGELIIKLSHYAPSELYYYCARHSGMGNKIIIG